MRKETNIQKLALFFIEEKTDKKFKDLYERLRPGLMNHCITILKDVDLAEDAFLNCMMKIWLKIDQYDIDRGNFSTWCYNIARNESLLLLKSRKRYVNQSENEVEYTSAVSSTDFFDQESDPNWDFMNDNDSFEFIYDAILEEIHSLPPIYKEIMIDREINHMKYKDIAEKYNTKKRTIATQIRRGRNKIRKKMDSYINIGL